MFRFFGLTRVIFVHRGTLQYNLSMFVFWGLTRVCGGHMATVQYGRRTVRSTSFIQPYYRAAQSHTRYQGVSEEVPQVQVP